MTTARLFAAFLAVAFATTAFAADAKDGKAAAPKPPAACPDGKCPLKSVTVTRSRTSVAASSYVLAPAKAVKATYVRVQAKRPHAVRRVVSHRPHLLGRAFHRIRGR